MKKIFNGLFYFLRFILLIGAFGLTLFVLIRMNMRLEKSIVSILPQFLPFIVLLILFLINLIFQQQNISSNIFYNLTCCLVFTTIIFVSLRSILDTNMVLNAKYGYGVDFNYFDNFLPYVNIMLYGLIISNILFMFKDKDDNKKSKIKKHS